MGDRTGEARTLSSLGKVHDDVGEKKKAVDYYNQALPLWHAMGDHAGEARTLNNLGKVHDDVGEKKKAVDYYNQALPLWRAVGDSAGEARTLNNLGKVHDDVGEKKKAVDYYNQALPLWHAVGDRTGEATTLSNIGAVYSGLAEKPKALDYFNQALKIWRAVRNLVGEATTLNNIGTVYSNLGEKPKALDYYNQALPLTRAVSDRAGEATTLNNIGEVYSASRLTQKALDYYNPALALWRAVGDPAGEAGTLDNLGKVYHDLGELQKALDYYNQALPLRRAVGDRTGEATTLSNIGTVYSGLGRNQKALDYYNQALPLTRAVSDRAGEATTLNNIALVYDALDEHQKALDYYNQALLLRRAVGDRAGEAITLNNLGALYSALGENSKSIDYYNQALPLARAVGDRAGEARTLNNLGVVYETLGEKPKALDYYNWALPLMRSVSDRADEAGTLSNLMHVWKDNNTALAIFYGKQAVNTYQQLRANIRGLDKAVQKTFLHSKEDTYRFLADLLISRGRLPEAQQVLGMLKEHEYFEFVRRDASVSALLQRSDLTPDEGAAIERYKEISSQIVKLGSEFSALKESGASPAVARYQTLKADLEAANRTFQVLLRQLADEFGKENEEGKRIVKALKDNEGLQSDLKRWGSGVVALYTVLSEENYHVILTTSTLQVARAAEPKTKAVELNKLVLEFREAVENQNVDPRPLGQRLYKILIAPVAKDLEAAGAKTIIWSLDGTLRYLPMAALHDGQQYFVERYQNVIITLVSRTRLEDPPSRKWNGLGLGVSKGVVKEWGTFRPLDSVPEELRAIIREENQKSQTGVLPGKVMLDKAFTEQTMEAALNQRRYPLVHIASHFHFKPGDETNSFLLLGDETRLTLDKIRVSAGSFFEGVELLTLSACDTATGGGANGQEIEGFAVTAQKEGAQAVLATLWPVHDNSTKLLMEKFYQYHAAKPGTAKVEALRQAQLALLRPQTAVTGAGKGGSALGIADKASSAPAFKADPKAPFAHPYFWAPFILIGNWR